MAASRPCAFCVTPTPLIHRKVVGDGKASTLSPPKWTPLRRRYASLCSAVGIEDERVDGGGGVSGASQLSDIVKNGITSNSRRFGFVSLLGPTNSGKSTLLNRLVGTKVAIVTPKVQTTRCRIAGIVQHNNTQIAYLDTPGIFKPSEKRLDRAMVKSAWRSGDDGDVVSCVLDVAEMFHVGRRRDGDLFVSEALKLALEGLRRRMERGSLAKLCFCANKIDAIPLSERPPLLERVVGILAEYGLGDASVFAISARDGDGMHAFSDWVAAQMPLSEWMYPEDHATDMSSRLVAAEVTREKIFILLRNELPYEVAVDTTSYAELEDGSIRITQDILVRRESQLKIVTGQGGSMVKKIGMQSRQELKEMMGVNVHLMLKVKVKQDWKESKYQYDQWGLDYTA